MTPTIRIRYQDENGAEFFYRGTRVFIEMCGEMVDVRIAAHPCLSWRGAPFSLDEAIRYTLSWWDERPASLIP